MIVRQSSISNAVATLAIEGSKATANDVFSVAQLFESYVLGETSSAPEITEEPTDIPF